MSRIDTTHAAVKSCFPRVSGDEPDTDAQSGGENTFSPRERG